MCNDAESQIAASSSAAPHRPNEDIKPPGLTRSKAVEVVSTDGRALERLSEELKADKQVVLSAVKKHGLALSFASASLQADKEVVLAAVKSNGWALKFASEDMKADKEVVMLAVGRQGGALQYACKSLKSEKEVVLSAVNHSGLALRHAGEAMRGDEDVVMLALGKQDGSILMHASDLIRSDERIMLAAVVKDGTSVLYASETLRAHAGFLTKAKDQAGHGIDQVAMFKIALLSGRTCCFVGRARFAFGFLPAHHDDVLLWSARQFSFNPLSLLEFGELYYGETRLHRTFVEHWHLPSGQMHELQLIVKRSDAGEG